LPPDIPLLSQLQRLIETSYDWTTGIDDLGPFVVGDEGYRQIYGGKEFLEGQSGQPAGARTLVTWVCGQIRVNIYYPDHLVVHLERRNPLYRIDDENVTPFSILVEELDHLLMLAWCVRHRRNVRLVELEFHANVTKYLVLTHFLARLNRCQRLSPVQRRWVFDRLFGGAGEGLPPALSQRYETAEQLALRFIHLLDSMPAVEKIRTLRRFARRAWGVQRSHLESLGGWNQLGLLLVV